MSRRANTPAWLLLATLALVAINLRAVLTAIPPLTLEIQATTGWNDTAMGFLTTLPVIVMGLAALIVPALAQRIGRPQTVWIALALLVVASGARVAADIPGVLFVTAFLGGLGIAFASGLVPAIVREDLPRSTGAATGLWTASMFTGAALAAALTVPVAIATGSWEWGLAVWAVPAIAALVLWTLVESPYRRHASDRSVGAISIRSLPWRNPLAWALTAYLAINSIVFYTALAWVAPSLDERGWTAEEGGLLFGLFTASQIVAALTLPWIAQRFPGRRILWTITVIVTTVCLLSLAFTPGLLTALVLFLFGFSNAGGFTIGLSMLSESAADSAASARLTAMAFAVTYLLAAIGPTVAGALLDAAGSWTLVYVVLAIVALTQIPVLLPLRKGTVIRA
ncbi:MAG: CynX/NimT family MFS transporter [Candidatus Nanopelagicales bacterium]